MPKCKCGHDEYYHTEKDGYNECDYCDCMDYEEDYDADDNEYMDDL
jgi:hypothetical protein